MQPVRKLALSLLAVGVVGSMIGVGTFASFSASVANSGNTFATGTLLMTNSGDPTNCTAVKGPINCSTLSLSANSSGQLVPGSVAVATITISNAGTLPATMSLSTSNASAGGLASYLNMTIYDNTTGYCIYGHASLPFLGSCDTISGQTAQVVQDAFGNVGPLTVPPSSGSLWAAAESHFLQVTIEVANPSSGPFPPSGTTASLDFVWTATQGTGTSS